MDAHTIEERGRTLEKHWVGKEWELLEGSLVVVGILEEARAALVAMAATKDCEDNYFLTYILVFFLSILIILQLCLNS